MSQNLSISIIVPVYNSEKFISICIESILNQNFHNYEVILINDGSSDSSLKICEEYSKLDKRIQVIDQVNKGVSHARNIGIEIAQGEYIVFIDADDELDSDYLKLLYQTITNSNCDLIVSGYILFPTYKKCIPNFKRYSVMKGIDFILSSPNIHSNNDLCFCWRNIYRLSTIRENRIFFNENIHIGEDVVFNLELLVHVDRVMAISDCLYRYRINNENSVMRVKYRPYLEASILKQYELRKKISLEYNLLNNYFFKKDMYNYILNNIYRLLVENAKNEPDCNLQLAIKRFISSDMIRDCFKLRFYDYEFSSIKEYIYFYLIKFKLEFFILKIETKYIDLIREK
ncbi:glycosyltransferase [Turicibacter sanguinis]|uniref:glycosyltransferase n=1 Tax=Turicibacter sanguinis TaxID=154288 RepID=UPI001E59527D|nr:glycosyltransferase [Turicibacter sanguinis]MDB8558410.1 glycosyltransferase [Turicibacter sanguinis]MDB8561206.1 glycosyltransferase [Turicibacter sanguinis]